MTVHHSLNSALDYRLCRYGDSRVDFRGPKRDLDEPYVAVLGGTETFGKYIEYPYPDIIQRSLGMPCINFGCVNAGLDVFMKDPEILSIASKAEVTVIQVVGALNMSNRFYRVHPRRNDRFLTASSMMQAVFSEVDFTEFNFTRHMLQSLAERTSERVSFLRQELRAAWCARMSDMLDMLPGPKLLFWFAAHVPSRQTLTHTDWDDPLFIDKEMLDALRPQVDEIVEANLSQEALSEGVGAMCFPPMERKAAEAMLGPQAHQEAATTLLEALRPRMLKLNVKRPT